MMVACGMVTSVAAPTSRTSIISTTSERLPTCKLLTVYDTAYGGAFYNGAATPAGVGSHGPFNPGFGINMTPFSSPAKKSNVSGSDILLVP